MSTFGSLLSIVKELFRIKHKSDLNNPDKNRKARLEEIQVALEQGDEETITRMFEDLRN